MMAPLSALSSFVLVSYAVRHQPLNRRRLGLGGHEKQRTPVIQPQNNGSATIAASSLSPPPIYEFPLQLPLCHNAPYFFPPYILPGIPTIPRILAASCTTLNNLDTRRVFQHLAMAPLQNEPAMANGSVSSGLIVKIVVCLVCFIFLIVGFCLVARKSRCVRNTQTSTLVCTHTPIMRGGMVYPTAALSRDNCARCLANRCKRESAADAIHDSVMSSPTPSSSSSSSLPPPYPRSLSPVPLSPLPALGLTGLGERVSPPSPPPVYRAALDAVAFAPRGRD
ncbi:hypothetical protein C8Q74DRAFT_920434 [Fomes fomentarius]|nr:hypothetical protein C8Q74DRAFT_920434 [Fomes fomentarius]